MFANKRDGDGENQAECIEKCPVRIHVLQHSYV